MKNYKILGSDFEQIVKPLTKDVFQKHLGDNYETFLTRLGKGNKDILLTAGWYLHSYIYNLPNNKELMHIRDIYGYIGLITLTEYCASHDKKYSMKSHEAAFVNYLDKGLLRKNKLELIDKLKVYNERADLSTKARFKLRLILLYEFRSDFLHNLILPPQKTDDSLFLAHFHNSKVNKMLTNDNKSEGLFLTIKLSFRDLLEMVEIGILHNLGYRM